MTPQKQRDPNRWAKLALALILAAGLGLRLYGAWRGNLMYDESVHWAFAREISLRPGEVNLVFRTMDHPLLSAYVVKASSVLFGASNFGLRVLHVLLGTATIFLMYRLGRLLWNEQVGLLAAGLLAVDQFHVSWSRFFMPEILMLFFEVLVLLFLWRALGSGRWRDYLLSGLFLGLACLSKETALLLFPALALGMLLSASGRTALRTAKPYGAVVAALIVMSVDIIWNLKNFSESYLSRDMRFLSHPFGLSLKSTSLYLGGLYRLLINRNVLGADYVEGNAYTVFWPVGAAYLASVVWSLRRWADGKIRLLLVVFLFIFLIFTFLHATQPFDPYWWASLSLVPAVLLTALAGAGLGERRRWKPVAFGILLAALTFYDLTWLRRPGHVIPRLSREEWGRIHTSGARRKILGADADGAFKQLQHGLLIDPDNAETHLLMGQLMERRGEKERARYHYEQALMIDASHPAARALLDRLNASR